MTSLLAPDRSHLDLFTGFAGHGAVHKELPIATRRLDEIDEIDAMDFLKIDIQGGELDVFEVGAPEAGTCRCRADRNFVHHALSGAAAVRRD